MTDANFLGSVSRRIHGELLRSRDTLVPLAYSELWATPRFSVWYGGRGAAKSWSISRVLLMLAHESALRVLCCREIQGSIRESAYRLLADQIQLLQMDDAFDVGADNITGKNGSRFFFEGLRYNASKIRSYEGVDTVWVEEAQSVSEMSWETLLPTIRKPGSRFVISFNPISKDDPVARRFVENTPPNSIVRKVSYRDNPYLSPEAEAERLWLEKTDPDAYRHVWEGEPRTVSDALILKDKYSVAEFEISPAWAGPYYGLDYGFSSDPCAGLQCHIDDDTRTLYVSKEYWGLHVDIDALPAALESAIPGISRHVVYADSARPESTSYLTRNGIPNVRSVEKWPGSVDDGIAYLRSFARIVIAPECRHFIDECGSYSFKVDRLTGVPLPEPIDANNHLVDSARYALSPLIRNLPVGGYFSRTALLMKGEPVELPPAERLMRIFATAAICERASSAVGVVYFGATHGRPLTVLDYAVAEVGEACSPEWIADGFARCQELRAELNPVIGSTSLYVEAGELFETMAAALGGYLIDSGILASGRPPFDLIPVEAEALPPADLATRAAEVCMSVNAGGLVKLSRSAYARQVNHRDSITNHLTSQLFGFRPGADAAQELVSAFVLGVLISRDDQRPNLGQHAETPAVPAILDAPKPVTQAQLHAEHMAAYQAAQAEWQAKAAEATARIRLKLNDPLWQPSGWFQLGIGRPPTPPGQAM
ncbi:MAG: PBSX family phage terminase large subunit [Gammaproteobacteria bacterium]